MKRRLLLLRHAKSDWEAPSAGDHDRPLAPRGRRAARAVGHWLRAVDRVPDLVISSSAVRARSTVELAAEAGAWDAEIEIEEALYGSEPARVLEILRRRGDDHQTVLLAGHEPVWSRLTGDLIGGARVRFPTGAVAAVRFDIADWKTAGNGELEWLVTPKLLLRAAEGAI